MKKINSILNLGIKAKKAADILSSISNNKKTLALKELIRN